MESSSHCKGKTSQGQPCRRNQKLSTTGYCYQHLDQDPTTPKKQVLVPTKDVVDEIVNSSSSSSSSEQEQAQSSNIDNTNNNNNDNNLSRCKAVASTTNQRCKRLVSFAGEEFCPLHGGRQHKAKVDLPLCEARSKRTRQQCKNRVTNAGQRYCHIHGAKSSYPSSSSSPVVEFSSEEPLQQQQQQQPLSHAEKWAKIQAQCLHFVTDIHPRGNCKCTPENPCRGITLVKRMQQMSQIAASAPQSNIFEARHSELAKVLPATGNDIFADLFLAVQLFGSNVFILPQLFFHIQRNVILAPPSPAPQQLITPQNQQPPLAPMGLGPLFNASLEDHNDIF